MLPLHFQTQTQPCLSNYRDRNLCRHRQIYHVRDQSNRHGNDRWCSTETGLFRGDRNHACDCDQYLFDHFDRQPRVLPIKTRDAIDLSQSARLMLY